MKAIILAAGIGRRLWPLTAEYPKCLLSFAGHTLLIRLLQALERADVWEVVIVVGYFRRKIMDAVARSGTRLSVRYVENPRYQKGSLLSLWRAREELNQDLVFLDTDVLCPLALRPECGALYPAGQGPRRLRVCISWEFGVGYELVEDLPWIEIDTPDDVERAEREIAPLLARGESS